MEATTRKPRGGKREPLPRFTITIPGYAKHQGALKNGHKRTWIKFERIASQELIVAGVPFTARALFYELVMISDEGQLADMTFALLSRLTGMDYRPLQNALSSLTEKRLVNVTYADEVQVTSKGLASDGQVMGKCSSSDGQGKSLALHTEEAEHSVLVSQSVSQSDLVLSAAQPTASAEASARKSINWDEQFQKAGEWLSETFPELATELSAYFMARVPAGSNPKQYVTSKIKAVKSQAKAMAAPREVFIAGWRAAMNKGADEAYASTVIENKVKEAFSGRQAGNQNARPLGMAAESAGSRNEPGQIWDVKL